jgi:hypothetical protein
MTEATLEDVISEVKKVNKRLDTIEKTLTTLLLQILPEEELTGEEWDELEKIEKEMQNGQRITLEELEKALR